MKIPLNTIDLAQTIEEWRPLTKVENDNDQVSEAAGELGASWPPERLAYRAQTHGPNLWALRAGKRPRADK